jgi:hypothetical protein
MKKMQEKTKAKPGAGMRPSMNSAMAGMVKRESMKAPSARPKAPSITVSDTSK